MCADKTQPLEDHDISMIKAIAELQVNGRLLTEAVKKLEDMNEGTVERKGMKERIALAEENINAHKQAWIKNAQEMKEMEGRLNKTLQEAFLEIKNDVTSKFNTLNDAIKTQQTFVAKFQPYLNILAWLVTLVGGWLVIQILGGNLQIVRTP